MSESILFIIAYAVLASIAYGHLKANYIQFLADRRISKSLVLAASYLAFTVIAIFAHIYNIKAPFKLLGTNFNFLSGCLLTLYFSYLVYAYKKEQFKEFKGALFITIVLLVATAYSY